MRETESLWWQSPVLLRWEDRMWQVLPWCLLIAVSSLLLSSCANGTAPGQAAPGNPFSVIPEAMLQRPAEPRPLRKSLPITEKTLLDVPPTAAPTTR